MFNDKATGIIPEGFRELTIPEVKILQQQGCQAEDWSNIHISPQLDLKNIINVSFKGTVSIDKGVMIRNVFQAISNCLVSEGAVIENVNSIEFEPGSTHGVGTIVAALDETGSRPVYIYPGLSSQTATLMAREPQWIKNRLSATIDEFIASKVTPPKIGKRARIINSGTLKNVSVGDEAIIEGALRLKNGSVINNAAPGKSFAFVGAGVIADNFIFEDASVDAKAALHNCYVGQGSEIGNGFNAHDTLIFSNCSFENGETCSLLAGPYTVSMHKGSLIIACQTSFMNAGSATNQSNHMYKLGPIHWGVLERGVKTSSGSYLMHGARIGCFSLLMGLHKTHPDSSSFPFSYLFGDERGFTTVVPGIMLRSCGLTRDEQKWPSRDRRSNRGLPYRDRITFSVLNPFTVDKMLAAIDVIDDILSLPADEDSFVRYKGMKFTRAALERAQKIYTDAICKYLLTVLEHKPFPEKTEGVKPDTWVDLGGQIMPRHFLTDALESTSIPQAEEIFDKAFNDYDELQLKWIAARFDDSWRNSENKIEEGAKRFDRMIAEDRDEYLIDLERQNSMLTL